MDKTQSFLGYQMLPPFLPDSLQCHWEVRNAMYRQIIIEHALQLLHLRDSETTTLSDLRRRSEHETTQRISPLRDQGL